MSDKNQKKEVVQTLCRMCNDRCAINVYLEDGKIMDIDGYAQHPWNKGRVCAKARGAVDIVYHPDRILKSLKRTAQGWQEIELEQALDEIAEKIKKLQEQYGDRSMSVWKGEATGFNQQEDLAKRFCQAIGTPHYISADSICYASRYIAYRLGYGGWQICADQENSKCIIIWGANPLASHRFMGERVIKGQKNGAKLIVIDPRMSLIARKADIHVPIKPGTDGALAWGLINLLIQNTWYDQDFIKKYTIGFDKMADYARRFTSEFVEEETGVSAKTLHEMALLMFKASPKVSIYAGNALEHYENGCNNTRAISYLDALCGSLDQKGGNRNSEGPGTRDLFLYNEIPLRHLDPIGVEKFPVLYDFRHECNTMTAFNTMITGEPYPLKGLILSAGNPAMTNPNTIKVKKALESLDLLVVIDLFMTETAQLADYVIPAASFLERTELQCYGDYQVINLTKRIISFPDCLDEYQLWHDLAHRLGKGKYFPWENEEELNKWLLEPTGIFIEELSKHPEGIQYKPIRYCKWKESPLPTPSGKVEFISEYLRGLGYPELPEYKSPEYVTYPSSEYSFVLISGARKVLYVNSRNHNISRFRKAIPSPEVEMHPQDASILKVADGDVVKITSRIGSVDVPVKVMAENEILPGCIQVTNGWKEANINLVTHDDILDPLSGFPMFKGVQVKVEKRGRLF